MRARPSPLLIVLLAAAPAIAGSLGPAAPAAAQDRDEAVVAVPVDLSIVPVEGAAAEAAQAAYDDTLRRLAAATEARTAAEAELVTLAERDLQLTADIGALTQVRKGAVATLVVARAQMREAAVSRYVVSATSDPVNLVFDVDSTVAIGQVQTYSDTVREDRVRAAQAAAGQVAQASTGLDAAQLERVDVRARTVEVTAARDRAAVDESNFTGELIDRAAERDRVRATSLVRGVDFALVALDAYLRAAGSQSGCGVEWWALAGISRVEGRHGTYGGAELLADGDLTRPIIGIPLSGEAGTAVVPDSDAGALDGDPIHDRAVGPMQFIPQTWAQWGRDGDRDGDVDPQNLYDATASAAAYLCHGRQLDSETGLRAGYFSYNHSEFYVETVLRHAYAYRGFEIPSPA